MNFFSFLNKLKKKNTNFSVNPKKASSHEIREMRELQSKEAVVMEWGPGGHDLVPPCYCAHGRKREHETRSAWHQQNQNQPFLISQLHALFSRLLPEHLRFQNFLLFPPGLIVSVPMRLLANGLFTVLCLPRLGASLCSLCGCVHRWLACPLPIFCSLQSSKLEVENHNDTLFTSF